MQEVPPFNFYTTASTGNSESEPTNQGPYRQERIPSRSWSCPLWLQQKSKTLDPKPEPNHLRMGLNSVQDWHLDIKLDNDIAEVDGQFTGDLTYVVPDEKPEAIRGIRLELRYFTEGRGDRYSKHLSSMAIEIDTSQNATKRFEIPVPENAPISYDGQLIRVLWEIKATIDIARGPDYNRVKPVIVVPVNGLGTYEYPHPLRRNE